MVPTMIIMAEKDEYFCALLESEDWDVFHVSQALSLQDKKATATGSLREILAFTEKSQPENLWRLFGSNNNVFFVMIKKNAGDEPYEIAGITEIRFDETNEQAWLGGSHILTPHRKRGLSSLLYEARLHYLAEETCFTEASLKIKAWNDASIKAAKRAGFRIESAYVIETDGPKHILTRSLEDFRESAQHPNHLSL